MKLTNHPGARVRILTDATGDVCPHCGERVERVTVCGAFQVRCDPERRLETAAGDLHFVRVLHLCHDQRARRSALKDLIAQLPRR